MEAFNNGSALTDYEMENAELIGRGKFSVVHRTRRRRDGKQVALKKIQVFEMMDSKCRNECLNEIKLLQSLGHPNIVQYLDAFIEDNELHVAMELAERGDLGGLIKQQAATGTPLEETSIWEYFTQISDALRYMHGQRVMHRDIKPANVFIMDSGVLKLGDLGAWPRARAAAMDSLRPRPELHRSPATRRRLTSRLRASPVAPLALRRAGPLLQLEDQYGPLNSRHPLLHVSGMHPGQLL
jgi:serine/threonine protein kinase